MMFLALAKISSEHRVSQNPMVDHHLPHETGYCQVYLMVSFIFRQISPYKCDAMLDGDITPASNP